jgi:hypothetical protein
VQEIRSSERVREKEKERQEARGKRPGDAEPDELSTQRLRGQGLRVLVAGRSGAHAWWRCGAGVGAGLDVGVDLKHKGCGVHEDALESVADVVREN